MLLTTKRRQLPGNDLALTLSPIGFSICKQSWAWPRWARPGEVLRSGLGGQVPHGPIGAVGQGGLLLEGHGHHLAWAFISGRIAGRNAAFDVPRGRPLTEEIGTVAL